MKIQTKYYTAFQKLGLKKSNNNWYRFNAPNDSKKDFSSAVNFKYGTVKNFRTGTVYNIKEYVTTVLRLQLSDLTLTTLEATETVNYTVNTSMQSLPQCKSFSTTSAMLGVRARNYIEKRNLDVFALDEKGFSYCDNPDAGDWFGRIIIPYKANERLVYYTGRNYLGGDRIKYRNPTVQETHTKKDFHLYNEDALLGDEVFLLEGAFDAETIGSKAAASSGWKLSEWQKSKILDAGLKRLVFVPDGGVLGNKQTPYRQALQLSLEFIFNIPEVLVIPPHLFANGIDVNEWGRTEFFKVYNKAIPLTIGDIAHLLTLPI